MSKQHPPDGAQPKLIEIIFARPPSSQGTYQYGREDGALVHGDASGEWRRDENGAVEDPVFFMSPGWHRTKRTGEGA
jgi:hypothetical protein